ncbi:hypothetical protein FQR65_LT05528 [Abscondita terminalis]|nr:hypothetical protein FQR65_LT05528 [Abscondita terminalis]
MASRLHEIKEKNSNIKKIFHNMEYGNIDDSVNLAKAWLKDNENVKGTVSEDLKAIMLNMKLHHEWNDKSPLEKCLILESFAEEIGRNSLLICQLEMLLRGILANDTRTKALPLLIEYLQYYVQYSTSTTKGTVLIVIDDYCFLGMLGGMLGPALASGFNIVFYTEPKTCVITTLLMQLAEHAGIPKGTFTHITGKVNFEIAFENVDVISFPGNLHLSKFREVPVKYNQKIIGVTKSKTPMIVFNSADLDSACDSVVDAAWGYGASLPWRLNTILVQEDVFKTFTDKLKDRIGNVKMGTAFDKLADVSYPLIDSAAQILQKHLLAAKAYGIEIFQKHLSSDVFQPTLLIGGNVSINNVVTADVDLMAVAVLPFRTINEAVNLANNSRSGVGVSVWTENIGLANEVVLKLKFSNIWINSFGNFAANISFTPYKDSGIGFIGGQEGLFEYQNLVEPCETFKEPNTKINVKGDPIQSFYGGSFRKSESGIHEGIFDIPVAKDLFNAVAAGLKGLELWKRKPLKERDQLLKELAVEINRKKTFISERAEVSDKTINTWIEITFKAFNTYLPKSGNVYHYKSMSVQSTTEPLGVIAIHESDHTDQSFIGIITSLLLGNSIIVLNFNKALAKFYVEISKLLILINFPAGVFNIIINCNEDIVRSVSLHKELNAHLILSQNSDFLLGESKILNFKNVYIPVNQSYNNAVKIKNVWCNIGDSTV